MNAFAAVLHRNDETPAIPQIAEALSSIGSRPAVTLVLGRCALMTSPLHADDPPAPVATERGEVMVGRKQSDESAYAAWHCGEQRLMCGRDGLGIRLLYVAAAPDAIVVTNVLAAALRHPRISSAMDEPALIAFLAHGGPIDEVRTCYRDIRVLPPGHTLTIDGGSFEARLWRHWHFPMPDGRRRSDDEIVHEYRTLLADAVRDRLDPHGTSIFLSGGIDSTTMAAAATEVAPAHALHAITTRYPRYIDDVELPFTRAAADRLGLPLTVLDADRHAPWQVDAADPPLASPLDEPMLADWRDALTCAASHGTAALYGEDGDALLRPPGWQPLRNTASIAAIGLAAMRYALTERRRPYIGLRWRERAGIIRRRGHAAPAWLSEVARGVLNRCDPPTVLGRAPEALPPHPTRPEAQAVLTSTTISRHFASTIAPETTGRRVELRLPILDTRVIRFVMSIPAIPWCQRKTLPRRAYRGRLPDAVLDRSKTPLIGFNEAMVAAWRAANGGASGTPADPVARWIDVAAWTRTLQHGAPEAVMAAWRVSALDAWIAGRPHRMEGAACTR
jgi:asparagine synthase (glutamine-hydrolysing)